MDCLFVCLCRSFWFMRVCCLSTLARVASYALQHSRQACEPGVHLRALQRVTSSGTSLRVEWSALLLSLTSRFYLQVGAFQRLLTPWDLRPSGATQSTLRQQHLLRSPVRRQPLRRLLVLVATDAGFVCCLRTWLRRKKLSKVPGTAGSRSH